MTRTDPNQALARNVVVHTRVALNDQIQRAHICRFPFGEPAGPPAGEIR